MTIHTEHAEHADAIRQSLRLHGWTARHVSVRVEHYFGGATIHIVVKDLAIPLSIVRAIATPHAHYDRYIFTQYATEQES